MPFLWKSNNLVSAKINDSFINWRQIGISKELYYLSNFISLVSIISTRSRSKYMARKIKQNLKRDFSNKAILEIISGIN